MKRNLLRADIENLAVYLNAIMFDLSYGTGTFSRISDREVLERMEEAAKRWYAIAERVKAEVTP